MGVKVSEQYLYKILRDKTSFVYRLSYPLSRSMGEIYVLFRYIAASLSTAALDYFVFYLAFLLTRNVFFPIYLARAFSIIYNFFFVKRLVFRSKNAFWRYSVPYIALVCASGLVSYTFIQLTYGKLFQSVIIAKICAELMLYFPIFFIQKRIFFKKPSDQ